jgi:uncharacterized RDD family membrane protein YckC
MTSPQDPTGGSDPFAPGAGGTPTGGGQPYGTPAPGQPYGTPPPDYGSTPQGYGAAPQGYGTPPAYGAPQGYGAPSPFGQPGGPQLATWPLRVQSALVDYVGPAILADLVQIFVNRALGTLLALAAFGWALYNAYLQGTTGQSYGKKYAGTRLLREQDGQVIGGGLSIGRYFLHILDGISCLIGYLWPLWDSKRQTFADKIVKSVVIKV